eukprot:TRINITY_DN3072_c0_g1_i4.p4 TRINITY_DN3072_c0_g1~~TRINITY_DN3072_c0_g1_i4.p4  ORF type:complete len:107 (-),score=0.53 TRINITY_DN3072_c0_g1_i4:79-399(-)
MNYYLEQSYQIEAETRQQILQMYLWNLFQGFILFKIEIYIWDQFGLNWHVSLLKYSIQDKYSFILGQQYLIKIGRQKREYMMIVLVMIAMWGNIMRSKSKPCNKVF